MVNIIPYSLREYVSLFEITPDDNARKTLDRSLKYHHMDIKECEKEDFYLLAKLLLEKLDSSVDINGWFLGTDLPVVPDFDVLICLKDNIVNIDLKHEDGEKKFKKIKNKFDKQKNIINGIGKNIINIVFCADTKTLYKYDTDFKKIDFNELIRIIQEDDICLSNALEMIDSKNYLISPLKDIDRFKRGEYWLSDQQYEIRNQLFNPGLYGIEGGPGTGKTLIIYDYIRKYDKDKKILLVFGGKIRDEQISLQNIFKNAKLVSAKYVANNPSILNEYDAILIDESQRLHKNTRSEIISWIPKNYSNKVIAFFYDVDQKLGPDDFGKAIQRMFNTLKTENCCTVFKLTKNFRTNPVITAFVTNLFDLSKKPNSSISIEKMMKHVEVKFFKDYNSAIPWINDQKNNGYVFIKTTGDINKETTSDNFNGITDYNIHNVIGGEYEKVVTYIDLEIAYNNRGKLIKSGNEFYFNDRELYVNLTRAKEKLKIAIINNYDVYDGLMDVVFGLGKQKKSKN